MQSLAGLQITRDPTRTEWTAAYVLALENSIPICDSIYIGFATQGRSIMVTADSALIRRIRNLEAKEKLLPLKFESVSRQWWMGAGECLFLR
jgi:predicted nucleic acid-binding protein